MPTSPSSLTSSAVLVIDDEPAVLRMMVRTLLEAGYTVHQASNGQDALALADELGKPLDLVVTDVRMEPIGDPELATLLFSRGFASRFLFVSGYGIAADYNEQFGHFLPKPFSPQQLVEAVTNLLG
jgi:two-component system, cell cycle sensor histidine kinase and response regulator CckA